MRAFIFSLDAFVAFTLALIAIYSLIFFSSIPSSYYYLLTQGSFLSQDVLTALSTTTCGSSLYCPVGNESLLDNLASADCADNLGTPQNPEGQCTALVQDTVGQMIPAQFGYTLESIDPATGASQIIYDTSNTTLTAADPYPHASVSDKLNVSTEILTFGYSAPYNKPAASIYNYLTCNGDNGADNGGMITCSTNQNTNPSANGALVPAANVKVMKLTIFI
jgi:hypothetical protein